MRRYCLVTRTTKRQNLQITQSNTTQKGAIVNSSQLTDTLKNLGQERGQTEPGLVALYDIRPGNGAGLFLQPRNPYGAEPEAEHENDGSSVVAARRRPCMPARPAFSQNIQPSASPGPTAGIPVPRRDATMFHNVQPWPPPLEYVIHPELRTEHICPSSSASLLSLPARQCDISAAVIQRDSHRRYIRNSFVY